MSEDIKSAWWRLYFFLVTDRNELDKQIYGTFAGVGAVKDKTARATSGENSKRAFKE